ncbi:MAG: VCBS repeat-containing protein [Candidatus Thiodiazotropha sp.]
MEAKNIMRIENQPLAKKSKLSFEIKRIHYTVGLLGTLASSGTNAANLIERASPHAFSIPTEIVENIEFGPALTTLNGQKYLQFITNTQQQNIYQNIIAGPLDKLFDRTIPWNDVIYSSHNIELDIDDYMTTLVDLDGDGINTLIHRTAEYEISSSPRLITDDIYNGAINRDEIYSAPVFVDADNDGDLDMFLSDFKHSIYKYYENVGSAEAPVFDYRSDRISNSLEQYYLTLPPGFYDYFENSFFGSFPYIYDYPLLLDFDTDGDTDLLMSSRFPAMIKYFEQSNKDGESIYTEPFNAFPTAERYGNWITDFDTDGDLDLLAATSDYDLLLYERTHNSPATFAEPVPVTNNFRAWRGTVSFGSPGKTSISRSREIFKDIDNDGIQEILAIQTILSNTGPQQYQLLLITRDTDNAFDHHVIYRGTANYYDLSYSLQFIDGNHDGLFDIALQLWQPETGIKQEILLFEQQDPLTFSSPMMLAPDALDLNQTWESHLDIDFDNDGDIDTIYNYSVEWNLESSPGSISNFSSRAYVGEGPDILIGGFIIEGQSPQNVILRGIGPSLAEKGVPYPLEDPELYLFSGSRLIAHNDDWQSADGAERVEAAGIGLDHSAEAALRVRLDPGSYTVHLKGKPGDTGVGIIAIDTDNQMPTNSIQVNISGRAFVDEGDGITIGGFIIEGDTPVKVLIRGLGPSMQANGVNNTLADPNLVLFSGDNIISSNNDWQSSSKASEIAALENAPTHDKEAAILTELAPGTYTVHLRGKLGDTGIGIIAIDRI